MKRSTRLLAKEQLRKNADSLKSAEVPVITEASDSDEMTGDRVGQKRKRKKAVKRKTVSGQVALMDRGVSLGGNTPREEVVGMLEKHVKTKRTRRPATETKAASRRSVEEEAIPGDLSRTRGDSPTDFSQYQTDELIAMLRGVGVDMTGSDKEKLVQNCQIYKDLIIPLSRPANLESSGSQPGQRFTFEVRDKRVRFDTQSPVDFMRDSSTPNMLSIECDTELNSGLHESTGSVTSKNEKGKQRARAVVDLENEGSQGQHSGGEMREQEDCLMQETSGSTSRSLIHVDNNEGDMVVENEEFVEVTPVALDVDQEPSNIPNNNTDSLEEFRVAVSKLNDRVELLTNELRALSEIVSSIIGNKNTGGKSKTKGGRTSAHVRFHIETLLGRRSPEDPLPEPAEPQARDSWRYDEAIEDLTFDPDRPSPPADTDDPGFPYQDGPGNADATPQQLAVMWQMMTAVGVSSFRPDFTQPATSPENKWLWKLALKIFVVLVECGEYPGVSLDAENRLFIKTCMDTHILSLIKSYRQQKNWSEERKQTTANEVRRNSRMRKLVDYRTQFLLKEKMWSLLPIVKTTTSDDETDNEGISSSSSPRTGLPCSVREIPWRSALLGEIWHLVDKCIDKLEKSKLGKNQSSPRGRPRRQRFHRENGPISRIKAPSGLSIDCFDETWIGNIRPESKLALEIDLRPILANLKDVLNRLLGDD